MIFMYAWNAWCSLLIPLLGLGYGIYRAKSEGLPMEKLLSFILIVSSVALLVSVLLLKFIFCDSEKEYFGRYAVPLGAFGLSGSLLVITDLSEAWKNKNSL